jgi:hypothetical protein
MIKLASHQVTQELAALESGATEIKLAIDCLNKSAELMEILGHNKFADEIIKIIEKIGG